MNDVMHHMVNVLVNHHLGLVRLLCRQRTITALAVVISVDIHRQCIMIVISAPVTPEFAFQELDWT